MDYLIRFVQMHETFRKPEIDALAEINSINIEWLSYSEESHLAIIRFKDVADPELAARALMSRSMLAYGMYELWGASSGSNYKDLHQDITTRSKHLWDHYGKQSFRFELDAFQGKRTMAEQRQIMEDLVFMGFTGHIAMKNPDNHFTIFEDYKLHTPTPHQLCFGRLIAEAGRKATAKYTLKKRKYIATTSMDAELSLITANLALAAPGKLTYDPFCGTGSFPLACAHFGANTFGSDMDGRTIRGKKGKNVKANFEQYETSSLYLDGFVSDLTNTPLREQRFLDAILCDPPYGVREGLKVLGSERAHLQDVVYLADGTPAHLGPNYIPPKKPYSFLRMLDDILDFSARMLTDNGRLCMWMPVAGVDVDEYEAGDEAKAAKVETEVKYPIPQHPALELASICRQDFNKWSRRLLTYRRLQDDSVDTIELAAYQTARLSLQADGNGKVTADDLNAFRRRYFQGFQKAGATTPSINVNASG
ncbi:hypothetical protein DOTSEDRAFT_69068 [Dothistroma septosporum NZE10]|uniref:tRNA (guanine(10)-N(2))-methyltransferase n=1 Tax=Dothistroma septosporum (strain NZE10 / CBS 128990) TaxID=675120 RepID=N1Q5I7_DOTSN|nr:hypothetical protein DOTSEDRAFT_69068 [Dothistroma septosporum NZE10]